MSSDTLTGRVLVVGGGIGGLAAAVALKRAAVPVLVLERAPALNQVEVGAGITLWPNAVAALDRLGLADEVRARGHVLGDFVQRTARGSAIMSWSLSDWSAALGFPTLGVARPDLHSVLAAAAGDLVQTASECTEFQQDEDGVTVRLADGRSEVGTALLGADGLRSVVRGQLLGHEPPRFAGLSMWRANVALGRATLPRESFCLVWGRGQSFTYFRIGPTHITWQGVFATDSPGGLDAGGRQAAAAALFSGWPSPIPSIIGATPEPAIVRTDVFDRPPSQRWGDGRMTLLGDAAHAMVFKVGQGAGQALEDALSIGDLFSQGGPVEATLREYERQRIPRTAHWQKAAWQRARAARLDGRLSCGFRNGMFRTAARLIERTEQKVIAQGIGEHRRAATASKEGSRV